MIFFLFFNLFIYFALFEKFEINIKFVMNKKIFVFLFVWRLFIKSRFLNQTCPWTSISFFFTFSPKWSFLFFLLIYMKSLFIWRVGKRSVMFCWQFFSSQQDLQSLIFKWNFSCLCYVINLKVIQFLSWTFFYVLWMFEKDFNVI